MGERGGGGEANILIVNVADVHCISHLKEHASHKVFATKRNSEIVNAQ